MRLIQNWDCWHRLCTSTNTTTKNHTSNIKQNRSADFSPHSAAPPWPLQTRTENSRRGWGWRDTCDDFCQTLQQLSSLAAAFTITLTGSRAFAVALLYSSSASRLFTQYCSSCTFHILPSLSRFPANLQSGWNFSMNNWDEWQRHLIKDSHNMP